MAVDSTISLSRETRLLMQSQEPPPVSTDRALVLLMEMQTPETGPSLTHLEKARKKAGRRYVTLWTCAWLQGIAWKSFTGASTQAQEMQILLKGI